MKKEKLSIILEAVISAQNILYNDLDVICDDEYIEEVQIVLSKLNASYDVLLREIKEST